VNIQPVLCVIFTSKSPCVSVSNWTFRTRPRCLRAPSFQALGAEPSHHYVVTNPVPDTLLRDDDTVYVMGPRPPSAGLTTRMHDLHA
jgi:hypothetical protein